MSKVTNRISSMLSIVTPDMKVYVVDDEKLADDIIRGWPKLTVQWVPILDVVVYGDGTVQVNDETVVTGLVIMNDHEFLIKYRR